MLVWFTHDGIYLKNSGDENSVVHDMQDIICMNLPWYHSIQD